MITSQSVYDRLNVLIAKATSLRNAFMASPTGHSQQIENVSAHTFYGLPESINEDVEKAIATLVVAEKKIDAEF